MFFTIRLDMNFDRDLGGILDSISNAGALNIMLVRFEWVSGGVFGRGMSYGIK